MSNNSLRESLEKITSYLPEQTTTTESVYVPIDLLIEAKHLLDKTKTQHITASYPGNLFGFTDGESDPRRRE